MSVLSFEKELEKNSIKYLVSEPMSKHTSFRIGGNADLFVLPETVEELKVCLAVAKKEDVPVFLLGNGTNILVSDKGIRGAVVSTAKLSDVCLLNDTEIYAKAGAKLLSTCIFARDNSLSGLEFAYGIPGFVGGAVFMNAGAYGGEMKDVIKSVDYIDADGNIKNLSKDELALGYRTSVFSKIGGCIIGATLSLKKGNREEIDKTMKDIMQRRIDKQPLDYPSAGSVFKRPEGYFAGALIEGNNLKGASVGGAKVSEKHAGFIVNNGGATAKDVFDLVEKIQKTVLEKDGVKLECEIRFVGEK